MLRPDIDIEGFHTWQAGTLPDEFGARVTELQEGGRPTLYATGNPAVDDGADRLSARGDRDRAGRYLCRLCDRRAHLPAGAKGPRQTARVSDELPGDGVSQKKSPPA